MKRAYQTTGTPPIFINTVINPFTTQCRPELTPFSSLALVANRFFSFFRFNLLNSVITGTLAVDSRGATATEEIYDDANPDQIETLSPLAPHRHVDLEIVKADKEGMNST